MIRNDYRRALIMLRALEKGYSGHVRLERRTLRGNMQFSITAPSGGELHAAILARKPGTYAAEDLGALGRDGRGQAGLNATFDPRNILGNDLDECPLVAVALVAPPEVRIVLTGNLNGSCEIDWMQLRDAITRLYATERQAPEGEQLSAPQPIPDAGSAEAKEMEQAPSVAPEAQEETQETSEEAEENGMVSPKTTTSLEGEAQAEQAPEPAAEESSPESAAESEKSTPSASAGPYSCSETCEQKARQAQADASDAVRIEVRTLAVPLTDVERAALQETSTNAARTEQSAEIESAKELAVPLDATEEIGQTPSPLTEEEQMAAMPLVASEDEMDEAAEEPTAELAEESPAEASEEKSPDAGEEVAIPEGYGPYPEESFLNSIAGMEENAPEQAMEETETQPAKELNFDAAWPPLAAELKELFLNRPCVQPFPATGCLFVRAPMSPESGYADCIVGLKPENGIPSVIIYALEGEYALEPPPGLEGYVWRAGENAGYWTTWLDAQTGEQIDAENA